MSWTKKVTVYYYKIEAGDPEYFSSFYNSMETIIDSEQKTSSFEAGNNNYYWTLLERFEIDDTTSYFYNIVKEANVWPVRFTAEGEVIELVLPDGGLGDISFGLINPAHKFLICFAGGSGGSVTGFKKLLSQFSADGNVRLTPLFEENIDEKVLNWDFYKKISIGVNIPNNDGVAEFTNTATGSLMKMIEKVAGLKVDITVSAGADKNSLSTAHIKDMVNELLTNEFCTKLALRGADFDGSPVELYDIKNAQIKYSEQIEIEGRYIDEAVAKQVIMRALNERAKELYER